MNQLFCDCKTKCTCKKCPDVLKNLNITVTGSTCRFNKKEQNQTNSQFKSSSRLEELYRDKPRASLSTAPGKCFGFDEVPLGPKYNGTCESKQITLNGNTDNTLDAGCTDCSIVVKAMRSHGNLDIGTRMPEEELKEILKANVQRDEGKTKRKSKSKTGLKNVSKTVIAKK